MPTKCMVTGETLSWEDCLTCAKTGQNTCGWDYPLLRAIKKHQEGYRTGYHVSEIKACLRKGWYTRNSETGAKFPSESAYTFLGTMTHQILEEGSDHNIWTEIPVQMPFNGVELLGRVDAYSYPLKRVVDLKTTRRIIPNKLPYSDHEDQVRIYSLMLRHMGLPVESAAIQYIDLMGPTKCNYCKIGTLIPGEEYVCSNCGNPYTGKTAPHSGALLFEVELGDLDELEQFITNRLQILSHAVDSNEPPEGEPGWLCAYCPFNKECPDAR